MSGFRCWTAASLLLVAAVSGCTDDDHQGIDVILEWNAVALEANSLDHTGPDIPGDQLSETQGPPASARVLAIVHAAMFDAHNVIDRRYDPYLVEGYGTEDASIDAAVAQAAHDTLLELIPAGAEAYDEALRVTLDRVQDDRRRARGIDLGRLVASEILQHRSDDVDFLGGEYQPIGEPGKHDVDPKNPQQSFISPDVGMMRPFGVASVLPYRAPPPPSIDSVAYAEAFEEVERLGRFRGGDSGDTVPTDDETYVTANYWSYNGSPGIGTPVRLYNQITRTVIAGRNNAVHENARLFALINIAMADGGISAWDSKYAYEYWRPILGIRQAERDTNPLTSPDPEWCALGGSRSNPFLQGEQNFTPPFPSYTSGHATFGAAAFKMLANFYQRDDIPFTFTSEEWNGTTVDQFGRRRPLLSRSFESLSYAAAENAASRVFNGVHWRFDGTEGVRAGYAIANDIFDTQLRPVEGGPRAIGDPDFEAQIDAILVTTSR